MGILSKRTVKPPKTKSYRPNGSNLQGSFCIKKADEDDYQKLREFLYYNRMSIGEYLVEAYRTLDKD